jgi:hypothetical protein
VYEGTAWESGSLVLASQVDVLPPAVVDAWLAYGYVTEELYGS